jgi:hypothetical protein
MSNLQGAIRMNKFREQALESVKGGYDLHTHTTPSHFARSLDDFTLLREADQFGIAGVILKNHYEPSGGRAALANLQAGTKAKAYGSVVLNHPAGGLNPYAAESCLKLGGRMVWMPTRDSAQSMSFGAASEDFLPRPGITIFDEKGKIVSAVYEIFDVVKKYNVCLATGHLSCEESHALCKAGTNAGVRMILTHPDFKQTPVPLNVQTELAGMGVLIEKVWLNVSQEDTTVEAMADSIKKIGSERTFLVTDRGQADAEHPAEALINAVEAMLEQGLTIKDIENLVRLNSRAIINC